MHVFFRRYFITEQFKIQTNVFGPFTLIKIDTRLKKETWSLYKGLLVIIIKNQQRNIKAFVRILFFKRENSCGKEGEIVVFVSFSL